MSRLDLLHSGYERRVSPDHAAKCLITDCQGRDEIDTNNDAVIEVDPGDFNPPAQLKERELSRVLSILDDIEKEGGPA